MTCENLQPLMPMSLPQAFHVKTSATTDMEPALMASAAAYGARLQDSFARYDQNSQSWRTWQRCLIEGLAEFWGTWPRSGMTRSGTAYRLPVLAIPTLGTESGLLPTIGANESKGAGKYRYRGSTAYRGAKMSEGLRTGEADPIYLHPDFAEWSMGFPAGWTLLETQSSPKSPNSSDAPSSKRRRPHDPSS